MQESELSKHFAPRHKISISNFNKNMQIMHFKIFHHMTASSFLKNIPPKFQRNGTITLAMNSMFSAISNMTPGITKETWLYKQKGNSSSEI